jgi:hypothetical protein
VNIHIFPGFLQCRREVRTATVISGSRNWILSRQLGEAFFLAGWTKTAHVMTPGQNDPSEFAPVSDRGISVQFASDPKSRELGARIAADLKDAGLDCEKNEDSTQLPTNPWPGQRQF